MDAAIAPPRPVTRPATGTGGTDAAGTGTAGTGRVLLPWMLLLGVSVVVRVALAAGTDVYFDEAYYWQWARHADWSYYDHPPLVAWLIAVLGIRPTALLCGAGTVAAVWGLARDVHGSREAGWRAAALWSVVPAGVVAGVWATPDSPLLLCWALALWALVRERWVLAGLAAALGLLAKYPAVLLAVAFLGAAAALRRLPAGAWLTAGLALLGLAPVAWWNWERGWLGFAFQLDHGLGGTGGWRTLGEFVAGQLAMAGPVLLPLTALYVVRGPREQALLRAAALVPLLVFGLAAWRTRGEANWPAAAYLSACVGVAGMRPWAPRAAALGGLAVVLAVGSHLLVPLVHAERDVLLARTHGWSVLAALAEPGHLFADEAAAGGGRSGVVSAAAAPGERPVAAAYAPSYQLASQVAYYAGLPVDTAGSARHSQYDLWPEVTVAPGEDVLWVSEGAPPPEELAARFGAQEGPALLPADYRGRTLHTFHVWRLRGARDGSQAP